MDSTARTDMNFRPRQAVVLAAGRGSRMGPFTDNRPKCLYPLAGRPILEWTLQALRAQGVNKVLIIGGWCAEMLRISGTELRVNSRWQTSNMVQSLLLASDWLQVEPTLVLYGDGAYGMRAVETALKPTGHDLLVPIDIHWLELWRRRFDDPLRDAETLQRQESRILSIGQRPRVLQEVQGQFMGMLRTSPAGWCGITRYMDLLTADAGASALDRLDMTGLFSRLLLDGVPLHAVEVAGGWVEIDSIADVEVVEQAMKEEGFTHDFRY